MLGYFIVIAILGFIFTKMTIDILNWGIPEVIEQPNLSAESGIMDEIHAQDEYYSGDLGDEN